MLTTADTPANRPSRTAPRAQFATPTPDSVGFRRAELEIDVARLDILCASGASETVGRPRASVIVDSLTRMIVGASITLAEPNHRTLEDLVAREAGRAFGGVSAPTVSGASEGEGI